MLTKCSGWLLLGLAICDQAIAANSAGCGKETAWTDGTRTAEVNGKTREYIVKLPENYNATQPYKLIFTFHALGGSAEQIATGGQGSEAYYGIPSLADNSAIFVSPNGQVGEPFNMMGWSNTGGEDILFVDAMVEAIESELCVNQDLRFSTGFSFGGAISYAIACARAEQFRAVGIISGGAMSGCEGGAPSKPIAFYQQHGTNDEVLPIAGAREVRDTLLAANGCTAVAAEPSPDGTTATRVDYEGCADGYPAAWVVFEGTHTPAYVDSGGSSPMAGPNVWEFFSQFE